MSDIHVHTLHVSLKYFKDLAHVYGASPLLSLYDIKNGK